MLDGSIDEAQENQDRNHSLDSNDGGFSPQQKNKTK